MAIRVHSRPAADARRQAVADAVEDYDLVRSPSWSDLDVLSTHTYVDGVEVDPEGVVLEPENRFRGVLNVYLLLKYGSNGEEGFETSESFLGHFKGHFDDKDKPIVDEVTVDTSPFYEGEAEDA